MFFKNKAITIFLIIAVACFIFICRKKNTILLLYNYTTNEKITEFNLPHNLFSIKFIHSVHKTPLEDYYKVLDKKIYVYKTTYYDFGAGVQSELNDGEKFYIGSNSELIVDNINTEIQNLIYVVGTWSDHILSIDDKEFSLRDICGKNTHVRFLIQ
ncbi:MAG: DUF1850 domain-containing protein [Eubacteriales bacterium]|nr:DUF1850 domain-containing protein [Eubacteriales bacterium]